MNSWIKLKLEDMYYVSNSKKRTIPDTKVRTLSITDLHNLAFVLRPMLGDEFFMYLSTEMCHVLAGVFRLNCDFPTKKID